MKYLSRKQLDHRRALPEVSTDHPGRHPVKTVSFWYACLPPVWLISLIFSLLPGATLGQDQRAVIGAHAVAFDSRIDLEPLLHEAAQHKLILMGESSHGTSEFYRWRAELSRHLIEEANYDFIAVEGDWPAFSRINRYVKDLPGAPGTVEEALAAIDRWPHWMWRNEETRELIEWLRAYNSTLAPESRIGFYGVDLYAKQQAMSDVIDWFHTLDADRAEQVAEMYSCLSQYDDVRAYLVHVRTTGENCASEVSRVLEKLRSHNGKHERAHEYFNAVQNAKLVVNAERHYRANLDRGPDAWNHRAAHFKLTARRLLDFYGPDSRGIVWAHNTHIGDARATDMHRHGMLNIGQLSREKWGRKNVYAIGFGTYEGEVLAARQWEGTKEKMIIPPARADSWERLLKDAGLEQHYLMFRRDELHRHLDSAIPHRAIGVTYQAERDEQDNYVNTLLPQRYDAFIFIRRTGVLTTLD